MLGRGTLGILLAVFALGFLGCGGGSSSRPNDDLFTTDGFRTAYEAAKDKAGNGRAVQIQITGSGANFQFLDGNRATGFIYTNGKIQEEQVQVTSGGVPQEQQFTLAEVQPDAIDRIVSSVKSSTGEDVSITAMTLERSVIEKRLRWTVNAMSENGQPLVFTAAADGSDIISSLGGAGLSGSS